jgi:hypothetical protein
VGQTEQAHGGSNTRLPNELTRVVSGDLACHVDRRRCRSRGDSQGCGFAAYTAGCIPNGRRRSLTGFNQGTFTPAEAQSWASFVRRGYVARGLGPIRPLDIGYEEAWEEAIVVAVTQLDQIGDLMDGYVTKG